MRQTRVVDLPEQLAIAISGLSERQERVVVAIDGPDGAGKTTLADRLAEALRLPVLQVSKAGTPTPDGRTPDGPTPDSPTQLLPALRASVDGFNRPRKERYERGELSAEGYYLDSFDYPALLNECVLPFLAGDPELQTATFDHRSESEPDVAAVPVPARAVLVVDGVFLLRPELRAVWTLKVYLRVSPQETLRRAHRRDLGLFGSAEEIERRYLGRYLPGQALYRERADPERLADILVDNERTGAPRIERWVVPAT